MITSWYEVSNYGLSNHIDCTKDAYTFNSSLHSIFQVMATKINDLDASLCSQISNHNMQISLMESKIFRFENENIQLKKIIAKIAEKDFPELMIEYPELLKINEKVPSGL